MQGMPWRADAKPLRVRHRGGARPMQVEGYDIDIVVQGFPGKSV
jgi:hypothetical protein